MAGTKPSPDAPERLALARAARRVATKKTGKPVMTERTGNPSDPKDWTNAPGTAAWAKQLKAANGGK